MKINVEVDNIRCGGCINTITKKLMAVKGIHAVDIELETQTVTIDIVDKNVKETAIGILVTLGYPEKGTVTGIDVLKGKAKSVVSCAVGKI